MILRVDTHNCQAIRLQELTSHLGKGFAVAFLVGRGFEIRILPFSSSGSSGGEGGKSTIKCARGFSSPSPRSSEEKGLGDEEVIPV